MEVRDDGPVRTVTFDRPEAANALDPDTVAGLLRAVTGARPDGQRLLVLRARGRTFSAGFDLRGADEDAEVASRFLAVQDVLDALRETGCVTVAVVAGPAVGAGADLVAACDVRIGTEDAAFRFPGTRIGVVLGTRQLAARIGPAAALETLVLDATLDADTALRLGLLTHRVESGTDADVLVASWQRAVGELEPAVLDRLVALTRVPADPRDRAALRESVELPGSAGRVATFRLRRVR